MRTNGTPDPDSGLPRTSASPEAVAALKTALEQCPSLGDAPDPNPWHELFYERLRDQPLPALITDGTITPGASLWTGSRLWLESFRTADLQPGDRLVIALPPSTAFVQVLVAALWEGYTVALAPPDADLPALLDRIDARAAVTVDSTPHAWISEEYAGPSSTPDSLRSPSYDRTPHVRFLLQTSGTTAHARWIALSDRNVLSVLHSHLPHFALHDARLLSVLPWTHAFGLVLDLLPALFAGAEIIRDPEGGRDPDSIVRLRDAWGATHLSAVPLTIQRLLEHPDGKDLLNQLQGGIVGGAPISGPLAEQLQDTCLRVGYGQTEAAPGIALGPPGQWAAHYLGQPVGCSVEIAEDGELLFEGANACVGIWREDGLDRTDPDRTVHTGDRAERDADDLYFRGRKDEAFKLSNGRLVEASTLEAALKTEHPDLQDALIFSPDGDHIAVALCAPSDLSPTQTPDTDGIRKLLGPIGHRLTWTTTIPPGEWTTLPKGSVDRQAMTDMLTETYQAERVSENPSS